MAMMLLVSVSSLVHRAKAQVVISEFVASNGASLLDEDGDPSDWIELRNELAEPLNLENFSLTDDPDDLVKWKFPAATVPGKGYLVVFASGKDRAPTDGAELHTNFKLTGAGEFLALVKPDGETLNSVFSPAYPPQQVDIAYGSGRPSERSTVVAAGAESRWHVPASPEEVANWDGVDFDDSGWNAALTGVGFQYPELTGEGGDTSDAMIGKNASVFVRVPFVLADAGAVVALSLRMKFEDGFVAYLNGREVARFNAPDVPTWNSSATGSHSDSLAVEFETFDVADFGGALVTGTNVLAIHGMNATVGGSDLLVLPELDITTQSGEATIGYLVEPTPGKPNGSTVPTLLQAPAFSVGRGQRTEPFELELSVNDLAAKIYFTDDGDAPTVDDRLYTEPIHIDATTVIRAIAVRGDEPPSAVATHTYLFVDDIIGQSALHSSTTRLISESEDYGPLLKDSLLALPSVCLSMDATKPGSRETAVSIELFDPKSEEQGFQVDAGTKVVGGHSVSSPKNNFRVYFRSEYGASSFKYPLFEGQPYSGGATDEFRRLMLRSGSHDTFFWLGDAANPPSGGRKSDATYLRNRWINDMQFIMGHEALHGRFVQLFINGNYHGQYQLMEYPNDDFHASYLGGTSEDYHFTNGANREKTGSDHGNGDTWWANWAELKSRARGDDYAAAEDVIDMENLVDYMLLSYYAGNTWDWNPNQNWMAGGPKAPGAGGWKFYSWDCDIIFQDVNGNNLNKAVPDNLFADLIRNHEEFRILVRDRIYKHFFNSGALTPEAVRSVFDFRANQIISSIVAETARWQPASPRSRPWDRDGEWMDEWNHYKEIYFPQRTEVVLDQLRSTKVGGSILYPLDAPEFSQRGGTVAPNFKPGMIAEQGSIFFTTDGTDPRLPGGEVNPAAMTAAGGVVSATFFGKNSEWKFLDDGSDQGSAWREPGFDDSAWAVGQGQLGYGDGDEGTVVSFGENAGAKHVTTYLRKTLSVSVAADVTELTISLLRDDGAVVYVNGVEVIRDDIPEGAVAFDTLASTSAGGTEESTYFDFTIQPDMLVNGDNVIAVEVHQSSTSGSDMSFDMEVTGKVLAGNSDLVITRDTVVRMRAFDGENWSALNEAFFTLEGSSVASSENVTISEIHYNPYMPDGLEFVELRNTSNVSVNLSGARFTDGVTFTFPIGTALAPQSSLVVVENTAAFAKVYMDPASPWFFEGINVAGEYTGALRNAGETLALVDRAGSDIARFSYGDSGAWPGRADGSGSSLELKNPLAASSDLSDPSAWRPGSEFLGSPGRDGSGPDNRIVVNEVVSSPIEPAPDAIELLNVGTAPVDISGWFLSDTASDYKKYAVPAGTTISGNEMLVLTSDTFGFGLSGTRGDEINLVQANAAGNLLRFVDRVEFPAAAPGESYGRWPDGTGNLYPMTQSTLSALNHSIGNTVRIGPIVISELHYNPDGPDENREFIVITNTGSQRQDLTGWRMRGEVDYDFAGGLALEAGASMTMVGFDPGDSPVLEAFRLAYGSSPVDGFVGPWNTGSTTGGKLDDGGGSVRILRPGTLIEEGGAEPFIPYYTEDAIVWDDASDWPSSADGGGMALHRAQPVDRGDLAQSWIAGDPFGELEPAPVLPGYVEWASAIFPADTPLSLTAPNADYDGDHASNSAEYAFATNPLAADSATAVPVVSVSADRLQIAFRMRESSSLSYAIFHSTDLIEWTPIAGNDLEILATTPVGDGMASRRVVRLMMPVASSAYYRISATR
ncbi:MAG: lamin tail domain-containing protein [Verrucomicrobiae bacterium]|nr:lamin tail domain-containing protein [Verrucomicrobiae bacterium]